MDPLSVLNNKHKLRLSAGYAKTANVKYLEVELKVYYRFCFKFALNETVVRYLVIV